ncbi:MAG: peptidoglycan DD-metalloendopeptidase family protein [Polyangiaceae bacterium]|nr:peptidoglycan DD-metalloendopeptidase family protein [Polyangiaceae bacterium]
MSERSARTWDGSRSRQHRVRGSRREADLFWADLMGLPFQRWEDTEDYGAPASESDEQSDGSHAAGVASESDESLYETESLESDDEAYDPGVSESDESFESDDAAYDPGVSESDESLDETEVLESDEQAYDSGVSESGELEGDGAALESDEQGAELGLDYLDGEEFPDEASPAPMAVPSGDPVPFAPNPPAGSYWPVISSHARSREVNYRAADGSRIGSNEGRQFLASRDHGRRYHVGIDVFANRGDPVVAIADGRIVSFYGFCCRPRMTSYALFVDHGNVVVNYGEVAPDSLTRNGLARGSRVSAGQVIGSIGVNPGGTSMLHFETYVPGTTANARYVPGHRRPASLLNPTPYLLWLLDNGRTGSATPAVAGSPAAAPPQASAAPSAAPGASPAATPSAAPAAGTRDWTQASRDERMRYVMQLLVSTYNYPVNGAAGIVGNLLAESAVLPNRVEGSREATPMRARNFDGALTTFTADQVMNRSTSARQGPRLPGVGLAQWTSTSRRTGLFRHTFRGQTLGAAILSDMDAQVDYLVSELRSRFPQVDRVLRGTSVSVDAASDEVVYSYEIPAAVLTDTRPRRKRPRSDPAVVEVFRERRGHSQSALRAYQASP